MRLPEGKQKIHPGFYYELKPGDRRWKLEIKVNINWLGYFILAWNRIHEWYDIKWYQYPKVIWTIVCCDIKFQLKHDRVGGIKYLQ